MRTGSYAHKRLYKCVGSVGDLSGGGHSFTAFTPWYPGLKYDVRVQSSNSRKLKVEIRRHGRKAKPERRIGQATRVDGKLVVTVLWKGAEMDLNDILRLQGD